GEHGAAAGIEARIVLQNDDGGLDGIERAAAGLQNLLARAESRGQARASLCPTLGALLARAAGTGAAMDHERVHAGKPKRTPCGAVKASAGRRRGGSAPPWARPQPPERMWHSSLIPSP